MTYFLDNKKLNIRCVLLYFASFFTIIAVSLASYEIYWHLTGNIHTVIDQQVFRSARLNSTQLENLITAQKIKSIINLAPHARYQTALQVSEQTGTAYFELKMRAHGLPPIDTLKQLAALIKKTPRPVLIHCRQGADRTGLAAAIALILIPSSSGKAIQNQYSLKYGLLSSTSTAKLVMHYYFSWLKQHHWQTTPEHFDLWLQGLKVGKDYPYRFANYHN